MQPSFTVSRGRISLNMRLVRQGRDVHILLSGGDAHIGAIAIASSDGALVHTVALPHHREGELASKMATRLASALQATVCVSAGIHFANISRDEIATVLSLAEELTGECVAYFHPSRQP